VFSPDDSVIAAGTASGAVQLWDTVLGQPIGPPRIHRNAVLQLTMNPSGTEVFTRCRDQSISLQKIPTLLRDFDRLSARIESITGLRMDDNGSLELLDGKVWAETKNSLPNQ